MLVIDTTWLTLPEVAAHVRVRRETIRRWIISGKLPASRTAGGQYRIRRADVEALLSRDRMAS